jgi:hypothetical protein
MYNAGRYEDMRDSRRALTRFVRDRFRAGLRVGFAVGFAVVLTSGCMRTDRAPTTAPAPVGALDVSPFVLNAFLVPALDSDALPLRWTDPRPPSSCGSATTVTVNGEPLVAGALVPDQPFELEWDAEDCHPFGAQGPKFHGRVKLTVYREDWGFSAAIEPSNLRVTSVDGVTASLRAGAASLPGVEKPVLLTATK